MKVRRLTKVTGHGVLDGFKWPADLAQFEDRNLIYGWNGSGKTTLSGMLRELETRRPPGQFAEFELLTDAGIIRSDEALDQGPTWVRVFNEDFVAESVFTQSGELPPVLYIGKQSVETQRQLEAFRSEKKRLEPELTAAIRAVTDAESALDRFRVSQGKTIKEALRSAGRNPYNNYDKSAFGTRAAALRALSDAPAPLSDDERNDLRAGSSASALPLLAELQPDVELPPEYLERFGVTLARTIVSQAIPRLTNDPEVGSWVETGLRLHQARHAPMCLFCEQVVGPDTIHRLEGHFSQAFSEAVAEIEDLAAVVGQVRARIADIKMPVPAEVAPHLRTDLSARSVSFEQDRRLYVADLADIATRLSEKRRAPFSPLESVALQPRSLRGSIEAVNVVIAKHNREQARHEAAVSDARARLEEDLVVQVLPRLAELESEVAARTVVQIEMVAKRDVLVGQVSGLEAETLDHRPAADELTQDLADFLGRDELRFELDGAGYRLFRGADRATGLSQGEKSAIALLYFLKSLSHKDFDRADGVVIIDDPVSSLDSNALFCALGYLQAKTADVGQVFFLTHNFGFFREVRKWLKPRGKPKFSQSMYFLSCPNTSGSRRMSLAKLDRLLSEYDSEYQYLFKIVREASHGDAADLADLFHYPNVARRLLEAFLAFRMPDATGGLRNRLDQTRLTLAQKERLVRFLDVRSHADGVGVPDEDLSMLSATPDALRDVLQVIQQEDERHFERMVHLLAESARQ